MSETPKHRLIRTDLECAALDLKDMLEGDPGMPAEQEGTLSEAYHHILEAIACLDELPNEE